MARPKRQRAPRVSRTGNPLQDSFVAQEIVVEPPVLEQSAPVRASAMCRCRKLPKDPDSLFCGPCKLEYSKLWTTPASTEYGICVGAGE